MSNTVVGGYGAFTTKLSPEASQAFKEATERLLGVKYEPLAVAQQVVAGTNFAFFCNATIVVPGASPYPAMLTVYKPLEGPASVIHIQRLSY